MEEEQDMDESDCSHSWDIEDQHCDGDVLQSQSDYVEIAGGCRIYNASYMLPQTELDDAQRVGNCCEGNDESHFTFEKVEGPCVEDGAVPSQPRCISFLRCFIVVGALLVILFFLGLVPSNANLVTPLTSILPLISASRAHLPECRECDTSYLPRHSHVTSLARVYDIHQMCPSKNKAAPLPVTSLAIVHNFGLDVCENVVSADVNIVPPLLRPPFMLTPLKTRLQYTPPHIMLTALALVVSPYESVKWNPAAAARARLNWGQPPSCPIHSGETFQEHSTPWPTDTKLRTFTALVQLKGSLQSYATHCTMTSINTDFHGDVVLRFVDTLMKVSMCMNKVLLNVISSIDERVLYLEADTFSNETTTSAFTFKSCSEIYSLTDSLWVISFSELPDFVSILSPNTTLAVYWIIWGLIKLGFLLKFQSNHWDEHTTQIDKDDAGYSHSSKDGSCSPSVESNQDSSSPTVKSDCDETSSSSGENQSTIADDATYSDSSRYVMFSPCIESEQDNSPSIESYHDETPGSADSLCESQNTTANDIHCNPCLDYSQGESFNPWFESNHDDSSLSVESNHKETSGSADDLYGSQNTTTDLSDGRHISYEDKGSYRDTQDYVLRHIASLHRDNEKQLSREEELPNVDSLLQQPSVDQEGTTSCENGGNHCSSEKCLSSEITDTTSNTRVQSDSALPDSDTSSKANGKKRSQKILLICMLFTYMYHAMVFCRKWLLQKLWTRHSHDGNPSIHHQENSEQLPNKDAGCRMTGSFKKIGVVEDTAELVAEDDSQHKIPEEEPLGEEATEMRSGDLGEMTTRSIKTVYGKRYCRERCRRMCTDFWEERRRVCSPTSCRLCLCGTSS